MNTIDVNMADDTTKPEDKALDIPHLVLLRIRSLIADKEMVAATANRELQQFGEWQCDHREHHHEIDQQIEKLMNPYPLKRNNLGT